MQKLKIILITLFLGITITTLVFVSNFKTFHNINLKELEATESIKLSKDAEEQAYQDYFENIELYTRSYILFKEEADKKIAQQTSPEKNSTSNPRYLADYDDLSRIPTDYTLKNFSDVKNIQPLINQTPTVEQNASTQSVPNRVGFTASSINNGSTNINVYQQFTVTFDSPPTIQQVNNLRFKPEVNFTRTVSGNTVTITPTRMRRNTNYIFGINLGLGICGTTNCTNQDSFWSHAISFKSAIKEVILTGFTIQNKPIFAMAYGNADTTGKSILLTGATHGEEWHAGGLWNWIAWLDQNQNEFANQNKEMLVIQEINRDGADRQRASRRFDLAARYNTRGVNLNRNFPNQWRSCSICGSGPASEPETQAVIGVSLVENVTHMIAYHNQWPPVGIIFLGDNSNPDTVSWAQWTGSKTGYPVGIYTGPEIQGGGDVPGDQVVWAESVGIRGLLIEGSYRGVDDYGKNFPMYLALVREF